MPIHRVFLGGEPSQDGSFRPALLAAAEYLLARYTKARQARLGQAHVVVPSSRAGRRLLEILVDECERRKLILEPPLLGTLGTMPEHLYEIKRPLASDLTQRLAWAEALRDTPPKLLAHVVPHPLAADDWEGWLELGELLQQQHRELASDGLNFEDVLEKAKELPGFDEEPRWQTLDNVQKRYLALLDSLDVWDVQTARLFAIKNRLCETKHDLVLIGVADMNTAMRQMLDQVADRVTALVHAPQSWSDRFTEYGCIQPDQWRHTPIPFNDQKVLRVDGPADQAYAVAEQLASFNCQYRADEITLGLGDENIAPQIARQLSEFGIATRFVKTRTVGTTGPFRLLEAVTEYLRHPSFAAFAALVRHPDLYDWLLAEGVSPDVLSQLDKLQSCRLPSEFTDDDAKAAKNWPAVTKAFDKIAKWLKPLQGKGSSQRQTLAAWIEPIENCLVEIYRRRTFRQLDRHDHATLEACEQLQSALEALNDVPAKLAPQATVTSALDLVLAAARSGTVPPLAEDETIEMLGWFELPLDDAPSLIVTTFNEGFVPTSHSADIFLPNRLRFHLGLEKNTDRQYARDAYAASILLATRKDVRWIVARHDADRNPLLPSRLLFAADRETIATRAYDYFNDHSQAARPRLLLGGAFEPLAQSRLTVPRPRLSPLPIERLNVTDFRTYLACPYRFYLKRLMKLTSLADAAEELDGMQFGNLIHQVLQSFGDSEVKDLSDSKKLAEWLTEELYAIARDEYGDHRRAAVNIQVEQARFRLLAFARWQAEWRSSGWRIEQIELELLQPLQFGERTIPVLGRIDRVDRHEARNEWMVFDYKSGDRGEHPDKTHRQGDNWIDLQLPLYRRLAQSLNGVTAPPHVGYIVLPQSAEEVGARLPEWTEVDWRSADAVAAQVVDGILSQCFWPPCYEQLSPYDEFASICQNLVAGRQLAAAEEGASA